MAKVLIVEDSHDLKEMYQIIFRLRNLESNAVSTKRDMMRQLLLNKPDIILLDIMLKGEDGREICKEIKKSEYKAIPVILISASPEKLKDFTECQADDTIEKPFSINILLDKIKALLEKQKVLE